MKTKNIRIKTTDNFCPNYPNDEVELSFRKLNCHPVVYRVCVWGEYEVKINQVVL